MPIRMTRTRPPADWTTERVVGLGYVLLAAAHLGLVATDAGWVARLTHGSLMPVLAAVVWVATSGARRSRRVRLVVLALALSWLGDSVPALLTGDAAFLCMVGLFLCAQVAYVVAFWPDRHRSVLARPAVAGYAVAFVVLLLACAPGADGLLAPVVAYGACLTLMAVLATGVDRLAGVGGAVFFVSDGLIALGEFADWYQPPVPAFWVMATYAVGQGLLVAGVLRRERAYMDP